MNVLKSLEVDITTLTALASGAQANIHNFCLKAHSLAMHGACENRLLLCVFSRGKVLRQRYLIKINGMNIQSVLELLKFCDDVCTNFASRHGKLRHEGDGGV